jgi:acetyl esterase/lipase
MKSILAVLLFAAGAAFAIEPTQVIDLWPGQAPGEVKATGPEKDTSEPGKGLVAGKPLIRLGNVTKAQIHVFLPPKEKANGTAVVICPGGGFTILAWDLEGTEVAEWLNSLGVAAVVLKYRTPTSALENKWLTPMIDGQRRSASSAATQPSGTLIPRASVCSASRPGDISPLGWRSISRSVDIQPSMPPTRRGPAGFRRAHLLRLRLR